MLVDPVEFKVEVQAKDGSTKSLYDFNKYIDRSITLSGTIDPTKATGVIYDEENNQLLPVPTVFETVNGKTVADIKHLGSGIYTIISTEKTFKDVKEHWAKNDIETLAAKLIVNGKGENNFDPEGKVTRAEFAALLVRALGLTGNADEAGFKDISDEWYANAVNTAAQAGLIQGYTDGTFRPNARITRQEMSIMVMNAAKLAGDLPEVEDADELINKFNGNLTIKNWAKEAVAGAVKAGIIRGNTTGEFMPEFDGTRAEAAAMLIRTMGYIGFINKIQ